MGWACHIHRSDRINERYKFEYVYRTPYISLGMKEIESEKTVDEGARLLGTTAMTEIEERRIIVSGGRAKSALHYMKPHFDKFRRLTPLILTLFKHRTYIPADKFEKVIETLFDRYIGAKDANPILLRMTEEGFKKFMRRAEELTELYLK
ncbi:MAG: hypothetical protein AOA65_0099 [Candidatus Bathyarchaeota archaeon BA1]|nr:MAG: hypothetical protein AOA65_0099 [Candidatus Bathyarchaeota archaeon BA1]